MLIISWNCQRLGRPLTVQVLRGLCTTHRPSVIFLMETKNKRAKLDRIRQSLNFSNSCYVDPIGTSGGPALWWMDGVVLDIRSKSQNIFRCIFSPMAGRSWAACFIYAPPRRRERRALWKYSCDMAMGMQYPWLCVGDFNQVGSILEKQGGRE